MGMHIGPAKKSQLETTDEHCTAATTTIAARQKVTKCRTMRTFSCFCFAHLKYCSNDIFYYYAKSRYKGRHMHW